MVDLEHHHRQIRNKSKAVHVGFIPLALVIPLAWLYLSFGACQEAESPAMLGACRVLQLTPLLPVLIGAAVVGWIAWDVAKIGAHHKNARKADWGHAVHGYHSLDENHKRHVHWVTLQVVVVSVALVVWLIVEAYRTTH